MTSHTDHFGFIALGRCRGTVLPLCPVCYPRCVCGEQFDGVDALVAHVVHMAEVSEPDDPIHIAEALFTRRQDDGV